MKCPNCKCELKLEMDTVDMSELSGEEDIHTLIKLEINKDYANEKQEVKE